MMIDKEYFTVVLVDDDLHSMGTQIDDIEVFLKQLGLKMNLLQDDSGECIATYLNDYPIDVVFTDMSMEQSDDGLRVIDMIRAESDLIDILLYSGKTYKPDDYKQASHYTAVKLVEDKKIVDPAKTLIERNLSKWNDMIFLRGIVISNVIELEIKLNSILAKFFKIPEENKIVFNDLLLENFSITLEGKKKVLKSILEKLGIYNDFKKILEDIEYLQKRRNYLAHCKPDYEKRNLVYQMGEPKKFEEDDMKKIFSVLKSVDEKLKQVSEKIIEAQSGEVSETPESGLA